VVLYKCTYISWSILCYLFVKFYVEKRSEKKIILLWSEVIWNSAMSTHIVCQKTVLQSSTLKTCHNSSCHVH